MRKSSVFNATIPRLLGQRTHRDTERSRRGAMNSQSAMRAKIPRKKVKRINGSSARIVCTMAAAFDSKNLNAQA
jgi:hypothetical protein